MKIRRYTCKDMQEALLKVKMDLGSEAVIMNSRKVKPKGLFGFLAKPMIEVVAAVDDDYARPKKPAPYQNPVSAFSAYQKAVPYQSESTAKTHIQEDAPSYARNMAKEPAPAPAKQSDEGSGKESQKINDLENKVKSMESMLEQIYKAVQDKNKPSEEREAEKQPSGGEGLLMLRDILEKRDIEPRLIEKVIGKVRERGGGALKTEEVMAMANRILTLLLGEPEPLTLKDNGKPHIAIFIGPTGVGKTTTLAKLAADFTLNRQKNVGLITADTYRIAAVEQLKTYAEILNLPVTVVYSPSEIQSAIERLSDKDLILIDTAGRSHKNKAHFDELKALVGAFSADDTYLVMSANTGRAAIREILEYYAFIKNYKLLFTKLDESPAPGVVFNARYMTGKPLSYTTAGQSVPDDLDIADVKQMVTSILQP